MKLACLGGWSGAALQETFIIIIYHSVSADLIYSLKLPLGSMILLETCFVHMLNCPGSSKSPEMTG